MNSMKVSGSITLHMFSLTSAISVHILQNDILPNANALL